MAPGLVKTSLLGLAYASDRGQSWGQTQSYWRTFPIGISRSALLLGSSAISTSWRSGSEARSLHFVLLPADRWGRRSTAGKIRPTPGDLRLPPRRHHRPRRTGRPVDPTR